MIGALQWISSISRPDIAAVTSHLATFSDDPATKHLTAVTQVFRYLHETISFGIKIPKGQPIPSTHILTCFSDASLKRIGHEKATLGFVILLFNTPILWFSRRMTTIATSIFAAELDATLQAAEELIFVKKILQELSIFTGSAPIIFSDNSAVITFCHQESISERARHLDHKYFKLRELVSEGLIDVKYVNTVDNPSDFLTKPVNRPRLVLHREKLSVMT